VSRRLPALVAAAALLLTPLAASARTSLPVEPYDCTGPAVHAEPGTPEWTARELAEAACGEQRAVDTASNPLFLARTATANGAATAASGDVQAADPFRDPAEHDGHRFRWQRVSFTEESGQVLPGNLFLPCDSTCTGVPAGLSTHRAPYPAVVLVHGGAAQQEMYWWAAQSLAEAGYMVLTFQVPARENTGSGAHPDDTRAALDFLFASPSAPSAAGEHNPAWSQLDRQRVGLAGHSAGGVASNLVGQQDPRVKAIVSWDRAQSTQMPDDLALRTPALFVVADYNCQQVPVCLPQPYAARPDPLGPGNKDRDFQRLRAARVDTMKVALRAATHLDFTEFTPGLGSRHGTAVTSYYTRAWFDRYLQGARPGQQRLAKDALARLVAPVFDGSTDMHSISGGEFDPLTQQNVPAVLQGQPVVDRLSHHFRSGYWLEGGRTTCEDVQAGCR
jgi:dienelactone hydrolase